MKCGTAPSRRPYRMRRRADAAAATAQRIIQATLELHVERYHDQIRLEDVAERAGVTVQTVLRRFHSKEELLDAAADRATAEVIEQRGHVPVGDVRGSVENLLDHYDAWGTSALRLLTQEERVPQFRRITNRARGVHAEWVRKAFAPFLVGRRDWRLLEAELIVLTDVYVWKVLHLDLGLDRAATAAALTDMITAVVGDRRAA